VISARGIEGGGVYALSRAIRHGAALVLDLCPDLPVQVLADRLARMRGGESMGNRLRKLGLAPVAQALAQEWGRPLPAEPAALAARLKALPARLQGPRPMDEAISTAGGIARAGLTADLELIARPGTFACGEMLDWEAPTGGYLLTACMATGPRLFRQINQDRAAFEQCQRLPPGPVRVKIAGILLLGFSDRNSGSTGRPARNRPDAPRNGYPSPPARWIP
jgi:predicted flavoprotein YhiN